MSVLNFIKQSFLDFTSRLNSQQDLANRENQLNYFSALTYLPDPDPVLKSKGLDISTYRELLTDPHLSAVLDKRKSGIQSMLWEIEGEGVLKREVKFFQNYFENIDLHYLNGLILDCIYFGYQPFVVYWDLIDGRRIPRVEDRPQEYFFYDTKNQLRIKTKNSNEGIPAEELAFNVSRYKPTYLNPYGERIAAKVFWPITFKKGGFKFWLTMSEKYGMPFLVGKVPKGTKKEDADKFATSLSNMIRDAVAVINDTDSVQILEASGKVGSADLYEKLVEFCNKEISKAVLTVTNTVELQQGRGSYAASQTQKEGEEDINLSDQKIVENFWNKIIYHTHRLNFGEGKAPKFILYDVEDVDKTIAERDQILVQGIGIKFTKDYIKKTYNLEDDDFDVEQSTNDIVDQQDNNKKQSDTGNPNKAKDNPSADGKKEFAEIQKQPGRAELDNMIDNLPDKLLQLQIEQTLKPVFDLIKTSKDYSEVQEKLAELYPDMKTSQLESLLEKALFISEIWGRLNAKQG